MKDHQTDQVQPEIHQDQEEEITPQVHLLDLRHQDHLNKINLEFK